MFGVVVAHACAPWLPKHLLQQQLLLDLRFCKIVHSFSDIIIVWVKMMRFTLQCCYMDYFSIDNLPQNLGPV